MSKIHGKHNTRIYQIMEKMKDRCYNPNCGKYSYYGGRGIDICDEWRDDFMSFYDWAMNNGYADELTIDREDNNKGYSPNNCRWTTMTEQNRNTRIRKDNTSGYKGISFNKALGKWHVKLGKKHIKYSTDINDAIIARKAAELKYWGK